MVAMIRDTVVKSSSNTKECEISALLCLYAKLQDSVFLEHQHVTRSLYNFTQSTGVIAFDELAQVRVTNQFAQLLARKFE